MSHEIITIDDDDSTMCASCTFRNESNSRLCGACSAPPHTVLGHITADNTPQTTRVCPACTFANEGGALACSVCHTPLVDDVGREDHILRTEILSSSSADYYRSSQRDGRSHAIIPTAAELRERTVAAGGDGQASTPGLISRIHDRLLGERSSRGTGSTRKGDGGGAAAGGTRGVYERQTSMRGSGARAGVGRGELNLFFTDGGYRGGGRGFKGREAAAEWRLCSPRTAHCTQRGSHGSDFSCGYRNIQMLCSAMLEYPEYKRVLFGGSGCIPGVSLLQCWIERAWADGYDPQGCEQLGGPGALMGSETWIGATECAALLRSFGIKAEVIDFESRSPSVPAGDKTRDSGSRQDDEANHKRTKTTGSSSSSSRSSSSSSLRSPPNGPANDGGGGPSAHPQQQQDIRSFLPLSAPSPSLAFADGGPAAAPPPANGRTAGTANGNSERGQAEPSPFCERIPVETMRWPGTGQRLGSSTASAPAAAAAAGCARGSGFLRPGGGGGGGRSLDGSLDGRGGAATGWRGRGRRRGGGRGSIGKDAGDRMGHALMEWAWEYFCTPWGTDEDGHSPPASDGTEARSPRAPPPPPPPPPQPRETIDLAAEVGSDLAGEPPPRPEERGPCGAPRSATALNEGHESERKNGAGDAGLRRGGDGGGSGSYSSGSNAGQTQTRAWPRQPPPLYFQHDGHSRSVVGVLWPGGRAQAQHAGRGRGGGRGSGGRRRGWGGRGGGRRRPGCLLVFDPSHAGREVRDALVDAQKTGWARYVKRGEHALHRRQFQMVAIRPGLVEARQANAWKSIVSEKIWVD